MKDKGTRSSSHLPKNEAVRRQSQPFPLSPHRPASAAVRTREALAVRPHAAGAGIPGRPAHTPPGPSREGVPGRGRGAPANPDRPAPLPGETRDPGALGAGSRGAARGADRPSGREGRGPRGCRPRRPPGGERGSRAASRRHRGHPCPEAKLRSAVLGAAPSVPLSAQNQRGAGDPLAPARRAHGDHRAQRKWRHFWVCCMS